MNWQEENGFLFLESKSSLSAQSKCQTSNMQTKKNLSRKRTKNQPSLKKFTKKKRECYGANSKRKIILDKTLIKFITRDLQPLCILNDIGFQEFVYELNPRYSLPSQPTVTNVLIPKMYQEVKEKIATILNTVKYLAITFDGWTSVARESYLTVTGHFIFESKLQAALLNFIHVSNISSTVEELKSLIQEKVLKIYPNVQLVCAVTDNAANIIATCEKLKVKQVLCGAHFIQLVVNHAILATKPSSLWLTDKDPDVMGLFESDESENLFCHNEVSVYIILKKCKRITTFFHSSPKKSAELKTELNLRQMEVITLVQSVYTRWNSSYEMLKRIYKTLDCINTILLRSKNNILLLSHEETRCIPDILACLQIFAVMTEKLSGESYATISLLIPCTKQILIELKNLESTIKTNTGQTFRKLLIKLSEDRLLKYETRTVPSIATVMDPRFKHLGFYQCNNYSVAVTAIKRELKLILKSTTIPSINAQPSNLSNFDSFQKKGLFTFLNQSRSPTLPAAHDIPLLSQAIIHLDSYLKEPIIAEDEDVIQFWMNYTKCDALKKIALKYLCVPATAVPSERVHSTAENTISDRRARLTSDNVKKLMYLKCNYKYIK